VFDPTIIHVGVYTAQNPFRQACRVETITNGNNWRTVTVGAVTTVYITEAGAATEQGPTFGQPTYTVQSAHAFATVSHETLQDRPDIGAELGSVFAESKATYEENQFAVGAGTTVFPLGMFTDTAYTNQTPPRTT
jgi:HK97 family phage major capsid protein